MDVEQATQLDVPTGKVLMKVKALPVEQTIDLTQSVNLVLCVRSVASLLPPRPRMPPVESATGGIMNLSKRKKILLFERLMQLFLLLPRM